MKISCYVHPPYYGVNNLTNAILNQDFAFELGFESETETHRRILTLDQLHELHASIENAIKAYNTIQSIPSYEDRI